MAALKGNIRKMVKTARRCVSVSNRDTTHELYMLESTGIACKFQVKLKVLTTYNSIK